MRITKRYNLSQVILAIIGFAMVGKGCYYMTHGSYFVWPPNLTGIENEHVVGFLFILTGFALALMEIFSTSVPNWLKAMIYGVAVFLMASVATLEWCHLIFLGLPMSAISNTCLTLILLVLAVGSDKRA